MKIDSAGTAALDPVRLENAGVGTVATPRSSNNRSSAAEQPRKVLQKQTRSAEEIHKDVKAINEQLKSLDTSIRFSVDEKADEVVVRIVDKDSGEVIRQIPPESMVRLRESMKDLSGLFVEKKV